MLPEDSRILAFQRFYTLYATAERNDYKLWMYGREDIADADLPERTSLETSRTPICPSAHRWSAR